MMHLFLSFLSLFAARVATTPIVVEENSPSATHSVEVKITNIRNNKGRIQLQIYKDQTSFSNESPWKVIYISKSDMSGKSLSYTVTGLETGVYGFALLDDENNNKKMDYGLVMPVEGFGFSDYYHSSWSRPKFWDFDFYLKEDHKVKMVVRYV